MILNLTNMFLPLISDLQRAVHNKTIETGEALDAKKKLTAHRREIAMKCAEARRQERRKKDAANRRAVLTTLFNRPDMKPCEISAANGDIPRTSMQTLLDFLMDDGLVQLTPGDIRGPGRQVHYRLTTAGEKFVRRQMKSAA